MARQAVRKQQAKADPVAGVRAALNDITRALSTSDGSRARSIRFHRPVNIRKAINQGSSCSTETAVANQDVEIRQSKREP
jgi:hypothetical protein